MGIFHFSQRFPEDFGRGGGESEASRERERERVLARDQIIMGDASAVARECQDKDKRYDRQIRIWGKDGQRKLETANVCLLGAGPTYVSPHALKQTNQHHSVADLRVPGRPARDGLRS